MYVARKSVGESVQIQKDQRLTEQHVSSSQEWFCVDTGEEYVGGLWGEE